MTELTERTIRALRPIEGKQMTVSDRGRSGVRGLSILVNYGGTKIFYFRTLAPTGKQKRIRIGEYPAISLNEARTKAREYRRHMDVGNDLAELTHKANLNKRSIHTIGQLWDEYHIDSISRKKSAKFEQQLWNKHLAAHFSPLDIRSFTRDAILDFLLPYRRQNSPALSSRVQAILSQLGAYAVERRVLEFSPAYQLGKKKQLPTRQRYLSRYELATFWKACSNTKILTKATVSPSLAYALKIALLTCARRTEVAGIERNELDLVGETWTIPATRTKNSRIHILPLTSLALQTITEARSVSHRPNSRFIFPGRRSEKVTKGKGHIRGDALTRACSRLCKVLEDEYEIESFTPHDLRRTGATYMASDLKIDRFTISQVLNHSSDHGGGAAVTSVYARYDYMDEKKAALTSWADFILENAEAN